MVANVSMSGVITLLDELGLAITTSSHNKKLEDPAGPVLPLEPKEEEAFKQALESAAYIVRAGNSLTELVSSPHLKRAVDRIQWWADEENRSWAELFSRCCGLRDAIKIEFKEHLFYAYPREKGQKFSAWDKDWEKIHAVFPVRVDSFSATDLYALGHHTASVFHSMRVAEVGLRALANERRVKLPKDKAIEWGTWQEIIKALDKEIALIGQTWKAGKRKDAALEFYSGARADLNGFKDEFRNLVMHVREQYDEFQAARALSRVHDFMGRLAERMDYRHHRIKWGR